MESAVILAGGIGKPEALNLVEGSGFGGYRREGHLYRQTLQGYSSHELLWSLVCLSESVNVMCIWGCFFEYCMSFQMCFSIFMPMVFCC